MEDLKKSAEKLESIAENANVIVTEMRVQWGMMLDTQQKERMELNRLHAEERERDRKFFGRIIIGLILTIVLLLGGIIGTAAYLLTNYDFAIATYQDLDISGDGSQEIHDGIHYNSNPTE